MTCDELANKGGVYCENCNIDLDVNDSISPYGVLTWAIDSKQTTGLWLLGEKFK